MVPDEQTATPHISLALSPGHEARELGGMTKTLRGATDWVLCDIAGVLYSKTHDAYWSNQNTDDCGRHRMVVLPYPLTSHHPSWHKPTHMLM